MAASLCASMAAMAVSAPKVARGGVAAPMAPVAFPVGRAQRGTLQIARARVGGVEIPNAKRLETALTYVYGIGPTTARAIMAETELPNERVKDLSEDQLTVVRAEVDKYMTEGDLRRFNALNIKRLVEIGSFRGRRHIASLPVRGQKSKTNARTRKGRSKGAIAGKKIAKK